MTALPPLLNGLIDFLGASPTPFHATQTLESLLKAAGFSRLEESGHWNLKPGGRHYVVRNGSALAAFTVGAGKPEECGFRVMGAHTDSPSLKVKLFGEFQEAQMTGLRIEVNGSAIQSTWLDRDLGLAGRVMVMKGDRLECRLLDTRRAVCVVPNLAIHMNRDINKGIEYNAHEHLAPLFSSGLSGKELPAFLGRELDLDPATIVDADLSLYDVARPTLLGANAEFLVSGRLDNLAMCHAIAHTMTAAPATEAHGRIAFFFDNEENGSNTFMGADSSFSRDVLERIVLGQGGGREALFRASAVSLLVSADMAHAWHPNWHRKIDPNYAPLLNSGPVIKANGNSKYATNATTSAVFEAICRRVEVPVQRLINRADVACGSTIGSMSAAHLGIPTVDVGNPLLAMHSIRETAGTRDHELMCRALAEFAGCPELPR